MATEPNVTASQMSTFDQSQNFSSRQEQFLFENITCRRGNTGIRSLLEQCLTDNENALGFALGICPIVIWPFAHTLLYKTQRSYSWSRTQFNIRVFVILHWSADFLGCLGAMLAQQLPSQVMFAMVTLVINIALCFHCNYWPVKKCGTPARKAVKNFRSRQLNFYRYLLPWIPLLLCGMTFSITLDIYIGEIQRDALANAANQKDDSCLNHRKKNQSEDASFLEEMNGAENSLSGTLIFGYMLGSVGGALHCLSKVLDVLNAYVIVECSESLLVTYFLLFLVEMTYAYSVILQRRSWTFLSRSLPWILPRFITSGLYAGIIIQRILIRSHGKRRTLSSEDTECLISSASDTNYSSDEGEMVWVPMKTMNTQDLYRTQEKRIQIVSESEGQSDYSGGTGSRTNSEVTAGTDVFHLNKGFGEDENVTVSSEAEDLENHICSLNSTSGHEKIAEWFRTSQEDLEDSEHETMSLKDDRVV